MSLITWNPVDKGSGWTLSNNNLTASNNGSTDSVRATEYKSNGKWYWEVKVINLQGTEGLIGVANSLMLITSYGNANAKGYYAGGAIVYPSTPYSLGAYVTNDTIGVALDMDSRTIKFSKNGVWHSEVAIGISGSVSPFISNYVRIGSFLVNFGATEFQYPIPQGYHPYDIVNATWVTVTKHLIKSSNKIHILKDNTLIYPSIQEPIPQAKFEQWGMDTLEVNNNQINKVAFEMNNSGVLQDGIVVRKTVNKNEIKINSLEVR